MNFGIVYGQFRLNFWDCFRKVLTIFLELFQAVPDYVEGFFYLETDVFGFAMCFGIIIIR